MKPLYKTTAVIWSEFDPQSLELYELGREATDGEAYCSRMVAVLVNDPSTDPDWDGNNSFFGEE